MIPDTLTTFEEFKQELLDVETHALLADPMIAFVYADRLEQIAKVIKETHKDIVAETIAKQGSTVEYSFGVLTVRRATEYIYPSDSQLDKYYTELEKLQAKAEPILADIKAVQEGIKARQKQLQLNSRAVKCEDKLTVSVKKK